jgi:hypothetical protein
MQSSIIHELTVVAYVVMILFAFNFHYHTPTMDISILPLKASIQLLCHGLLILYYCFELQLTPSHLNMSSPSHLQISLISRLQMLPNRNIIMADRRVAIYSRLNFAMCKSSKFGISHRITACFTLYAEILLDLISCHVLTQNLSPRRPLLI